MKLSNNYSRGFTSAGAMIKTSVALVYEMIETCMISLVGNLMLMQHDQIQDLNNFIQKP